MAAFLRQRFAAYIVFGQEIRRSRVEAASLKEDKQVAAVVDD